MHLTRIKKPYQSYLLSFLLVTSNVPLNNITIQNQHIPCQARKQRDKINKLQNNS